MEIRFGKFETVAEIPGPIDLEAAKAEYVSGFLTVTLPKTKATQIKLKEE